MLEENGRGLSTHLPGLPPVVGISMILRAVAVDAPGGMHIAEKKLELTDEYLRITTDELERWKNR